MKSATMNLKERIESRLMPFVQRPMRYAGGELNVISKDPEKVTVHGVLCFPDLYDLGMSHTGIQILYHVINRRDTWALSRCFHPWRDAETVMREEGIPLYSLEYFSPVSEADFIGFTVQYELQYTNIVNMIDLAGLSPLREERSETDPLIIAGGPCVGNPEPLSDFIDVVVIGDGEAALVAIAAAIEKAKADGITKEALLREISRIEGTYIPAHYEYVQSGSFIVPQRRVGGGDVVLHPARIPVLSDDNYPDHPVVPLIEVTHKRLAVEVMRGCTRGCRFCSAGMYYRPIRERTPQAVTTQVLNGIATTGWNEIGLLSLSTADYSGLVPLLESLDRVKMSHHISCSLPSTRLDALTSRQLDLLDRVSPISSFTIAPEAGSERLRKVINKDFTDEVIYQAVNELMRRNVQTLKLYFMLGLPTEQQEDIDAIITMVSTISSVVRATSKRRMIHVSLSPFSPKPHTPFQWEKMDAPEQLLDKGAFIKRRLGFCKNVKVSYRDPAQTVLETVMARGDRRIAGLVYKVWQKGARFDGWDECFDFTRWQDTAQTCGIDFRLYLNEFSPDEPLPWSSVSSGVSREFLIRERERACKGEGTPDCRTAECVECGICSPTLKPVFTSAPEQSDSSVYSSPSSKSNSNGGEQQGATLYRFHYKKTDKLRFLGHLDMVAVFHRAARIAGFPLVYSKGYNPHPRISFGPPLPFGVAGTSECFDVLVKEGVPFEPMKITAWLPEGLQVTACKEISRQTQSLNAVISLARYSFSAMPHGDTVSIRNAVTQLLQQDSCIIGIEKKGQQLEKDIRPGIIDCSMPETTPLWSACLVMNGKKSCKPTELLRVLCPDILHAVHITRTECLDNDMNSI